MLALKKFGQKTHWSMKEEEEEQELEQEQNKEKEMEHERVGNSFSLKN